MRRFNKRGLALALPLVLSASFAATTQSASIAGSEALAPTSLIDSQRPLETANGCCWIYFWGRWICVPCG